jgi:hypothetical protein
MTHALLEMSYSSLVGHCSDVSSRSLESVDMKLRHAACTFINFIANLATYIKSYNRRALGTSALHSPSLTYWLIP